MDGAGMVGQRAVGDRHRLGTASRARGEDDVGQVVQAGRYGRGLRGVGTRGERGHIQHGRTARWQPPGVRGVGQRDGHRHRASPAIRAGRGDVDGQIGRARLECAQERRGQVRAPGQEHSDHGLQTDSTRRQLTGHGAGAPLSSA